MLLAVAPYPAGAVHLCRPRQIGVSCPRIEHVRAHPWMTAEMPSTITLTEEQVKAYGEPAVRAVTYADQDASAPAGRPQSIALTDMQLAAYGGPAVRELRYPSDAELATALRDKLGAWGVSLQAKQEMVNALHLEMIELRAELSEGNAMLAELDARLVAAAQEEAEAAAAAAAVAAPATASVGAADGPGVLVGLTAAVAFAAAVAVATGQVELPSSLGAVAPP